MNPRRLYMAVFLGLLAPIAAVVFLSALLLFGVKPAMVFAPGFAVKSMLTSLGFHAPNAVGVASTALLWWIIIAVIGLAWDRRRRRVS